VSNFINGVLEDRYMPTSNAVPQTAVTREVVGDVMHIVSRMSTK